MSPLFFNPEPKQWLKLGQRGPQGHFPEVDRVQIKKNVGISKGTHGNKEPANVLRCNP